MVPLVFTYIIFAIENDWDEFKSTIIWHKESCFRTNHANMLSFAQSLKITIIVSFEVHADVSLVDFSLLAFVPSVIISL